MTASAKSIYKTLSELGLTRAQARRLLPAWWENDLEKTSGGVAELAALLGRRLSLDVAALMEGRLDRRGAAHAIAYKRQAGLDERALSAASCVASSLAQAVGAATTVPYRPFDIRAPDLRRQIQDANKPNVVGFESLLALCWSHGIPVIPLPNLPVGMRKMDGAVFGLSDRPAIIIAKKKTSRAWLGFILAHEIGHIAAGHVDVGKSIVDVALQDSATYATESEADLDRQESTADTFALQLLGGERADAAVATWTGRTSPVELAVLAREAGKHEAIEPGHLVLRYAFRFKRWPEAMLALRFLSEDVDADHALVGALEQHLDLDALAEDLRDLVIQVTGAGA